MFLRLLTDLLPPPCLLDPLGSVWMALVEAVDQLIACMISSVPLQLHSAFCRVEMKVVVKACCVTYVICQWRLWWLIINLLHFSLIVYTIIPEVSSRRSDLSSLKTQSCCSFHFETYMSPQPWWGLVSEIHPFHWGKWCLPLGSGIVPLTFHQRFGFVRSSEIVPPFLSIL